MRLTTPGPRIAGLLLGVFLVRLASAQAPAPPKPVTLEEAIHLAEANEPAFAAAAAEGRATALERMHNEALGTRAGSGQMTEPKITVPAMRIAL